MNSGQEDGRTVGRTWVVSLDQTEFGSDLLHRAQDEFRGDFRKSVLLILKVAQAIGYAHTREVLHRDLKPANILLDEKGEPLVSDFGLAKSLDDSEGLTRTIDIFGTFGYMAPEQMDGPAARLTAASDIYSIGAILFELLTGHLPPAPMAVFKQEKQPAWGSRSLTQIPDRDLETICSRCLELEPSHRYASCTALASDLQSWLDDRPIKARPVSLPIRFGRRLRRDRKLAFAVALAFVLVCTAATWQLQSWKLQATAREKILAERSVAVMPFVNLDEVTPTSISGQSLADSLRRELNALGPAHVKTATSDSFAAFDDPEQVRKVGHLGKTRTVLTGTVRTVKGRQRTSFRLLDSATGKPLLVRLWEDNEQNRQTTLLANELARPIYDILSSTDWSNLISSKADPGLQEQNAREAILAGRDLMLRYTISDLDRAIVLFKKALREVPNSPLAHTYLAFAATARTHYIADWSYLKLGREEAIKAIQLSPTSGDAHRALASVYYQERRFTEALEEGMQTIETGGLEEKAVRFIGMTFKTLGRPDRALRWFTFASRLMGTPGDVEFLMGDCWVKLGEDERALAAYARSAELQPTTPQGGIGICHTRMLQGDFETARQLYQAGQWNYNDLGDSKAMAAQIEFFARNFQGAEKLYRDLAAADPDGGGAFYGAVSYQSALGRAQQALGDARAANKVLARCLAREAAATEREPENPEAFYRLAAIESSLGQISHSINHLRTAVHLGWIDYRSLAMDPRFDALRQNREFQVILHDLSVKVADMRSKIKT